MDAGGCCTAAAPADVAGGATAADATAAAGCAAGLGAIWASNLEWWHSVMVAEDTWTWQL